MKQSFERRPPDGIDDRIEGRYSHDGRVWSRSRVMLLLENTFSSVRIPQNSQIDVIAEKAWRRLRTRPKVDRAAARQTSNASEENYRRSEDAALGRRRTVRPSRSVPAVRAVANRTTFVRSLASCFASRASFASKTMKSITDCRHFARPPRSERHSPRSERIALNVATLRVFPIDDCRALPLGIGSTTCLIGN
jgi:hypothetical protein